MIYVISGRPGAGKGMFLSWVARRERARGRTVFADFWMPGAKPWLAFEDIASPAFAGAVFLSDEVGSQFNARNTMDMDLLVFAAATQHRKLGVDVYLVAQSVQFIDVSFRRICEAFGFMHRLGPDASRRLVAGQKLHLWQRPWLFWCDWFRGDQLDDSGAVRGTQQPNMREWFLWSSDLAGAYDTRQIVMPRELIERYKEQVQTASTRAGLPDMAVGSSYLKDVFQFVRLPAPRESMRETMKRAKGDADVAELVRWRGFYAVDDPEPDGDGGHAGAGVGSPDGGGVAAVSSVDVLSSPGA